MVVFLSYKIKVLCLFQLKPYFVCSSFLRLTEKIKIVTMVVRNKNPLMPPSPKRRISGRWLVPTTNCWDTEYICSVVETLVASTYSSFLISSGVNTKLKKWCFWYCVRIVFCFKNINIMTYLKRWIRSSSLPHNTAFRLVCSQMDLQFAWNIKHSGRI